MKRQQFVSPGALSRLFQKAADAWKQQQYQETIDTLERAARLDPANATVQLDLGRAYGLRYSYAEAERCFEKAVRFASAKVETLTEAGRRCQEFGNVEMASQYFGRATQEPGVGAEALVSLAELEERRARLDQARELVERALKVEASCGLARLARARLDRLLGRLAEAESAARTVIAEPGADPWLRVRAWYELGEILDRMTRYDEAMQAWLEAKAVIRPAASNHAATLRQIQERVREMERSITAAVLERWAAGAEALKPLHRFAILCGHPRSGTTLLEQMLDAHHEIVSAEETQILHDEAYLPLSRGFNADASLLELLESAPTSQLRQSRENYFRFTELFLGQRLQDKLLVDKNPALNVLIPAVVRIFPEARFLIALRDPRDVCLSCFTQPLTLNPVSSAYLTLEGTVTQYLSVMGLWRTLQPRLRNPFLEVRYEQLVDDLEGVSRKTLEFLGVEWDAKVVRFDEHARSKLVRSPSYAAVSRPLSRAAVGRWRNYQRYLEPYLPKLEPMIRELGY